MTPTATATQKAAERKAVSSEHPTRQGHLHVPALHVPHVPVPSVHVGLPTGTSGRALWWGGLAAVAAFGIVDWPVVGLVAAGSWVAEQRARSADGNQAEEAKAKE